MYFHDNKKSTNIDSEFNGDSNILGIILEILNKYKYFIIGGLLVVIGLFVYFLSGNNEKHLILRGEDVVTIYRGTDYVEEGFNAYNGKNKNLTNSVHISSNVNTDVIGEYQIIYTLDGISRTRVVRVVERPKEYIYIYLETVANDVNVYMKVSEEYKEPGYKVYSSAGKKLDNEVKVLGSVNTSKVGNYQLAYLLVDENGVTVSATRTVIVKDK